SWIEERVFDALGATGRSYWGRLLDAPSFEHVHKSLERPHCLSVSADHAEDVHKVLVGEEARVPAIDCVAALQHDMFGQAKWPLGKSENFVWIFAELHASPPSSNQ